jgi:hypothetical protein
MVAFWLLGVVTAYLGAFTLYGFIFGGGLLNGIQVWTAAFTAATGIPMIFLWRFIR